MGSGFAFAGQPVSSTGDDVRAGGTSGMAAGRHGLAVDGRPLELILRGAGSFLRSARAARAALAHLWHGPSNSYFEGSATWLYRPVATMRWRHASPRVNLT